MFTPDALTIKYIYGQILTGHFGTFQDSAFDKTADQLIESTIFLFNKIQRDTRYSPSSMKFFYQFNLRDLSKIIEGVMQSQHQFYKGDMSKTYSLWSHECKRVIEDRLINQ
jgi:dynein heavy chain